MTAPTASIHQALQATTPLLSPQWFRVARLQPRLDTGVRVNRAVVRGEVWHTLQRADGARSFRMNAAAWQLVGRWDGQHSLQRLWEAALQAQPDAAPTQGEVLEWLTRLQAAGFVSVDSLPDFGQRAEGRHDPARLDAAERGEQPQSWLAWRIPLGRPDAALARWAQALGPLLRWPWLLPMLMGLLAAGLALALSNASALSAGWTELVGSPRGWLIALVAYPLIKLMHEWGHGLVSRWHGAAVPQWGVTLLMLMPVPYVDASAASALPRAGQRLAVASAGILVEGVLASLGLLLALAVEPGVLRDAGLTVFFIGALSTLAVNANPLLRFDGYHMLCDALGLPNLATRSQRWWQQWLLKTLLGVRAAQPMPLATGEKPWLMAYAPLSLLMRWTVALAVLAWLSTLSGWLALAVAVPMAWAMLAKPALGALRGLSHTGLPAARQRSRVLRLAAMLLAALLLLCALPWPYRTTVQGIWWQPEDALLRTQVDGFVAEVHARHGQSVQAGEALLSLSAPSIEAEAAGLEAREQSLLSEHWQALREDPPRAVQLEQELLALRAALARAQNQMAQRVLVAAVAGTVAWPQEHDMPGRWLPRGSLVGHVVTGQPGLVKVVIPHEESALVARAERRVQLRRSQDSATVLHGQWNGRWSGGGAQLPSSALAQRHGGPIATDPADAQALKPLRAIALADVQVQANPHSHSRGASTPRVVPDGRAKPTAEPIAELMREPLTEPMTQRMTESMGERVWVRFDHGSLPLAWQAWQAMRQLLLKHFRTGP